MFAESVIAVGEEWTSIGGLSATEMALISLNWGCELSAEEMRDVLHPGTAEGAEPLFVKRRFMREWSC